MNKKTLLLGGILIILIALAYVYQGPLKEWRANLGKPKNFLTKVDVEQINKIEVTKDGNTTTLEKMNNRLKVGGTKDFYVNESLANNLIQNLEDATSADFELVSTNKDKKLDFQTDDSGTNVKLFQADEIVAEFVVGKFGSDFSSSYISKSDINETYLIKVNLSSSFNQSEWRDTTIFSVDKEKITKIRFQYPTREFTMERIDDTWSGTLPYKFSVDEEKIDKILNIMYNLNAVKIPEQTFEGTGLDKHNIIVQATGEGIDNTIMIGDSNDEELYYVKKGDSDNIYLISKWQGDELDKRISDLR